MTDNLPTLMTLGELADIFRSTAKNRARAGRQIADRHELHLVEGHRPGIYLVPGWEVERLIGRPTRCPHCDREVGPQPHYFQSALFRLDLRDDPRAKHPLAGCRTLLRAFE